MWTNLTEKLIFFDFLFFLIKQTGLLITPMKDVKNRTTKSFSDDGRISSLSHLLSTPTDYSLNSINDEFLMEPNVNKTFFRSLNYTLIVSQVGSFVQIPCRVHLIGDEMVKSLSIRNCFNYSFIIFHFYGRFYSFVRFIF